MVGALDVGGEERKAVYVLAEQVTQADICERVRDADGSERLVANGSRKSAQWHIAIGRERRFSRRTQSSQQ